MGGAGEKWAGRVKSGRGLMKGLSRWIMDVPGTIEIWRIDKGGSFDNNGNGKFRGRVEWAGWRRLEGEWGE